MYKDQKKLDNIETLDDITKQFSMSKFASSQDHFNAMATHIVALREENERLNRENNIIENLCEDRFNQIASLNSQLAEMRANSDLLRQGGEAVATVIKNGPDRQWMSERLGPLPDGAYSLYLAPQPAIPPGYVVVPIEPSDEMLVVGYDAVNYGLYPSHSSVTRSYEAMLASAPAIQPQSAAPSIPVAEKWQPIETAPTDGKNMFVVAAFGVESVCTGLYNSDPYCVWFDNGQFIRWPHSFLPTHWMPLPAAPADSLEVK